MGGASGQEARASIEDVIRAHPEPPRARLADSGRGFRQKGRVSVDAEAPAVRQPQLIAILVVTDSKSIVNPAATSS